MQGLNEALMSISPQTKPNKPSSSGGDDSFFKMIENSVKEREASQSAPKESTKAPENGAQKVEQSDTKMPEKGAQKAEQSKENSSNESQEAQETQASQTTKVGEKSEAINGEVESGEVAEIIDTKENKAKPGATLLANADFIQLLGLLESENGDKKTGLSTELSANLNKFLATEKNVKEIKSAKTLQDIINLSEKFGLNLSKIKITKEDIKALKAEFSALDAKGFFNAPAQKITPLHALTKKDVQKSISKIGNDDSSALSKLLNGQKVESKKELKAEKIALQTKSEIKAETKGEIKAEIKEPEIKSTKSEEKPKIKGLAELLQSKESDKKAEKAEPKIEAPKVLKAEPAPESAIRPKIDSAPKISASIDEYLANIMQKAIKESGEQTSKIDAAAQQSQGAMKVAETSNESGAQTSQNDNQNATAGALKDVVNSAKLNSKEPSIKHVFENFATELKDKISEYKPPITRFHMTLNPGNLGEVEVTLINRGSNLHINFNTNNQTMQIFMQNQAEFKASLVNMGFTELSMNFSEQGSKEQQQNSKQRAVGRDFENVLNGEEEESVLLEVVLPKYF